VNETFGKYRLTDRLALGGMAEVFRAEILGEAGFAKPVVIKRLHARFSEDESFTQMLIDEARITSRLLHANICQVLDLGSFNDSYYLALEFIAGDDLKTIQDCVFQRGERLPVEAALFIASEMLAGLDYAHRQVGQDERNLGIVHRDVSPHNVLVSYEGEVKVIDFGIAKARMRLVRTAAGVIKGKFRYMSPEQASAGAIDHRSDQFAAAVVLYEMLRGSPHSIDVSDIEALRRIREAHFEPLTHSRYDLSTDLTAILEKALARDPTQRFRSCGDFRKALLTCLRRSTKPFGRGELAELMRQIFSDERRRQRSANYAGPRVAQGELRDSSEGSFERTAQIVDFSQVDALPPASVQPPATAKAVDDTQASRPAARVPAKPAEPAKPAAKIESAEPAAPPAPPRSADSSAIILGSADIDLKDIPTTEPDLEPRALSESKPEVDEKTPQRQRRGPQPKGYLPPRLAKKRLASQEVLQADATATEADVQPHFTVEKKVKRKSRGGKEFLRTFILLLGGIGVVAGVYFGLDIPGLLEREAALLVDYRIASDGGQAQDNDNDRQTSGPAIKLTIRTVPKDARVSICKRRLKGRTPLTTSYQPTKRCSVVVSKAGYVSQRKRLSPSLFKGNAPQTISFKLRPRKRTSKRDAPVKVETFDEPKIEKKTSSGLQITSMRRGKVFVDGRFRGYTPKLSLSLAPGSYQVWLTYPSLGTSTPKKRAVVSSGQTSKLHFEVVK
jgi:serine/threonine protein kinase